MSIFYFAFTQQYMSCSFAGKHIDPFGLSPVSHSSVVPLGVIHPPELKQSSAETELSLWKMTTSALATYTLKMAS